MISALRRLFSEPRPVGATGPTARDWLLALGFAVAMVVEITLRVEDWLPAFLVIWPPLALNLLWRRTHPFVALAGFLVPLALLDVALARADLPLPDIYSSAFGLIVVYAAFRWGSGREMQWAIALCIVATLIDTAAGFNTIGDTIGGFVVLACTAEAGLVIRRQRGVMEAHRADARSREREQLARELHDTIAHHVSAIAVQAQAGRAVLDTSPEASAQAFEAIEESASRALAEMRVVVDALRTEAPVAPQRGVEHIAELATESGPTLVLEQSGRLEDLSPQVGAALYRLAQESITNVRRHAPDATRIVVSIEGTTDEIRLEVENDGPPVHFRHDDREGFGLTGMEERAVLLGGTFSAGPLPFGGWKTKASIPRDGRQLDRLSETELHA